MGFPKERSHPVTMMTDRERSERILWPELHSEQSKRLVQPVRVSKPALSQSGTGELQINPSVSSSQTAEFNMEERSAIESKVGTEYVDSDRDEN